MVKLLLKHGADSNKFSEGEKSVIQIAEELGHTEIYQMLKKQETLKKIRSRLQNRTSDNK